MIKFSRDREGDSFRGWLWTITLNKLRDHFRRRATHLEAAGGADAQALIEQFAATLPDDPGEHSDIGGQNELLLRALDQIRPDFEERTWTAFWQTTVDGQSASEAAESLGMTPKAVRQAKYRVTRRLRDEFADLIN